MNVSYNFKDFTGSDISLLIQAINVLGEDLIGLELGVLRGDSSMTILQNCSIKKLYLVDNWKPYYDYLKTIPDGQPAYYMDQINQELNEFMTRHKIKYSGYGERVSIMKENSIKAANLIKNNYLDFIFFDAMMTEDQTFQEALAFFPKIKKGGFFMGHDADTKQVIEPINKVKQIFKNENKLYSYGNTFLFKI